MAISPLSSLGPVGTWIARIWEQGYMGVDVGRILLAVTILAVALLLRKPFGNFLLRRIRVGLERSKHDTSLVDALGPATGFVLVIVAAFVVSEFVVVNPRTKEICVDVNRSLVAFTLFWAFFEIIPPLVSNLTTKNDLFGESTAGWIVRVAKIVVLVLGAATILEIWGIRIGAILAGLGLVGAAVALGAQDLFKNLIAGIFIIAERRFNDGDWICADGVVEGTVEVIGLRTTKVRRFDMAPVYVPNSKLADNAVTNFAQMTHRQISWIVGLEYGASVDQLRRIRDRIEAYILGNDDFVHPPDAPTFVRIDSFGDSAINMMVYGFTRTTDWGEWLKAKEALAYAIQTIVAEAGSDFAFPSQSLYVEKWPAGTEFFPVQAKAGTNPTSAAKADAGTTT